MLVPLDYLEPHPLNAKLRRKDFILYGRAQRFLNQMSDKTDISLIIQEAMWQMNCTKALWKNKVVKHAGYEHKLRS